MQIRCWHLALGLLWEQVTDLPWVVSPPWGFMWLAISLGPFPLPVPPSLTPFGSKIKRGQGVLRTYVRMSVSISSRFVLMCQANIVELY